MNLNITPLSQRDPKWASQRLGTVDATTIGGYGCIITCMCMMATYYGHPITPDVMDNWLTDNQGYVQGNLYRNDAFPREFPDCTFDSVVSCTTVPAPLTQIDAYLAQKKPVVVMVDFDRTASNGIQTHFVLIVGREDNGDYIINDPWYGDQIYFKARYGDQALKINQVNFFSGPVGEKTVAVPQADFKRLETKSSNYDAFVTAGFPTVNDVTTKLKSMQDNINSLQSDNLSLQSTVASLNHQIDQLTEQMNNQPVSHCEDLILKLQKIKTIANGSWFTWLKSRNEVRTIIG